MFKMIGKVANADVAIVGNMLQAHINKAIFIKQLQRPVKYVCFCVFQAYFYFTIINLILLKGTIISKSFL